MARAAQPKATLNRAEVVIVGGGLSGLCAAMALVDEGRQVLVIEREGILGGRARSWTDKVTGDPVHIGPHILLSEYPNMRRMLELLGTWEKVVWQTGEFVTMVEGRNEIPMSMAPLPAPLHFAPSVWKDKTIPTLDAASNLAITLFAFRLTEDDIRKLDNVTALSLLRSFGVTDYFIDRFWNFTAMAIMNIPVHLCSAGSLMRFYRRFVGHSKFDPGFPGCGLGDLFAPGAKEYLEKRGGHVWLKTSVRTILSDGTRATGVELADGRQIEADHVIAALPPQGLRRVLPRSWIREHKPFRELVHFQACPYVSTYLWYDKKLTEKQFWARTYDANDLNCDFYDYANIIPGRAEGGSFIATNCIYCERANEMTDEEIVSETVRELAEYLPEAGQLPLRHAVVNRIPMAIHCPYPGMEQRRAEARSPIPGLTLAGDWIKTVLPSSMESACFSGWRAAEEVLADCGVPRSLAIASKDIDGLAKAVQDVSRLIPVSPLPRWVKRASRDLRA